MTPLRLYRYVLGRISALLFGRKINEGCTGGFAGCVYVGEARFLPYLAVTLPFVGTDEGV